MTTRHAKLAAALALLALLARPAEAKTVHVYPGDDIFSVIAALAEPGDTVRLHKGVYQQSFIAVLVPGITIRGDGSKTIIDSQGAPCFGLFVDGVTIRDIAFANSAPAILTNPGTDDGAADGGGPGGRWRGAGVPGGPPADAAGPGDGDISGPAFARDIVLRDNRFLGCRNAIDVKLAGHCAVTGNSVDGGLSELGAIAIEYEGVGEESLLVHRNTVHRALGLGLLVEVAEGDVTVSRNRVESCGGGIAVGASEGADAPAPASTTLDVSRNVVTDAYTFGMYVIVPDAFARVERNSLLRNGSGGLWLLDETFDDGFVEEAPAPGLVVERNRCDDNFRDGLAGFSALPSLVVDNRAEGNLRHGIDWRSEDAELRGNRCRRNRLAGLSTSLEDFGPLDGVLASHSLLIASNRSEGNGRDGILVTSPVDIDTGVIDNRCSRNRGDGIDLHPSMTGVEVSGNRCDRNGHHGISNSASGTDITDNECDDNGRGVHVDIAGRGDGGGSVGDFSGNGGTGGELADATVDLDP